LLAAALVMSLGCGDGTPRADVMDVADYRRPIELLDLDGRNVNMPRAHQGQVVVAVFTQSDCPISNRYAPDVKELCEKFAPQGVKFYLVYVDPRETPEAIRAHLAEYEYPCDALRDPDHKLAAYTGAKVTPEAAVFDGEGDLVYRGRLDDRYDDFGKSRPEPTKHDLAEAIEAALAGRHVAEPVTKAIGCYIEDLK
jgi:hypothetical protein